MAKEKDQAPDTLAAHLERFKAGPTAEGRVELAEDVTAVFNGGRLSNAERAIACEIFDAFARDLDSRVRRVLAEQLCNSPLLPPELARTLAEDVDSIACPILRYSQVLGDDDLIAIIAAASRDKMLAISRRDGVSAQVGDALLDQGSETVAASLLSNPEACLPAETLNKALDRHPESEAVHAALVERPRLPPGIVVRLIERVSEDLIDRLFARHGLPSQWRQDLRELVEGAAVTDLAEDAEPPSDIIALVDSLHRRGKLNGLTLLRALMMREDTFVFHALARLTSHSDKKVRDCLMHGGMLERRELYNATGLPAELFPAFNAAVSALRDDFHGEQPQTHAGYQRDVVARIVRGYPDLAPASIDNILAQLEHRLGRQRMHRQGAERSARP